MKQVILLIFSFLMFSSYGQKPVFQNPGIDSKKHFVITDRLDNGVWVNTDFDISLIDASGKYFSWPRSQVKVELEDKLNGHRAMLPKYSDADINNLAAYLVTLK